MTDPGGPVLLIFEFPSPPPERRPGLRALAESIAREPGLLWKIWTESAADGRAGGVYLFESRAAAQAYHRMHAARLEAAGISGIEACYRDVNGPLTAVTRGPVPG